MATCCYLGRSRPLLVGLGLAGGVVVLTALGVWLALMLAGVAVLTPAAAVSRRARARWRRRARSIGVAVAVSREKLGDALEMVAPRARSRVAGALLRRSAAAAGFLYRHFVGLAAVLLAAFAGLAYALIRWLTA